VVDACGLEPYGPTGLRRRGLVTRDAHALHAPSGFTGLAYPDRYMEKLDPDVYKRAAARGHS